MPIIGGGGGGGSNPFNPVSMLFEVNLPNFPEWAIPMTKVIPRVYLDDGYDITTVSISVQCQHFWHVTPSQDNLGNPLVPNVTLRVLFHAHAQQTLPVPPFFLELPIYVDIDLVFINERDWKEINNSKT